MAKKIFVPRNAEPQGRPPFVKYLLWGAVGLVVLILVAPLFQQKGNKGTQRATEKGGVVGEIPRTGLPGSEEAPPLPGQLPEANKSGDGRVMPIPPEIKGFTDAPPKTPTPEAVPTEKTTPGSGAVPPTPAVEAGAKKEAASETVSGSPGTVPHKPAETASVTPGTTSRKEVKGTIPGTGAQKPKADASSTSATESSSAAGGAKSKEAAVQTAAVKPGAEEAKSKRPMDKGLYTVQVGSFQEKRHADEMQQNLQKRGYKVIVRVAKHPKLGEIHVVQLEPVAGIDKASTLVAQIKNEQKVNPIIQKASKGE